MVNRDDKHIWANLVESHTPVQLGRITKRLNWVEDTEESHMSDTDYLVPVLHDGSHYHTDSYWDKALDWTKGWVDDDNATIDQYTLHHDEDNTILPGMIVRRVKSGWTLHQIPDELLAPWFNSSSEQLKSMNSGVARLLMGSDLEKHRYVDVLSSPEVARSTLRRLR